MRITITRTGKQSFFGMSDLARAIQRHRNTVIKMVHGGKIPAPNIESEGGRLYWSEQEFRYLVAALLEEQASRREAVKL